MKALIIAATAAASLLATAASAATAQQASAAPANPGPVIPGVCVYYNARLLAQSSAGQAVEARMQQLAQEVQGELQPYATAIQSEAQQLQTSGASLPADQLQQRRQALQHEELAAGRQHLVDRRLGQQRPHHQPVQRDAEHGDDRQAGGEGEPERPAGLGVEEPDGVHADHDELGVAEPDHVDDAENQVEAERRQGEDAAQQDAVDQGFDEKRIHQ
jgi:Skp family chaperone for outer membrane proteins